MRRSLVAIIAGAAVVGAGAYAIWPRRSPAPVPAAQATEPAAQAPAAEQLDQREIFEPGPVLRPSAKATRLVGKRVRMVGSWRAWRSPQGGFYWCRVRCTPTRPAAGRGSSAAERAVVSRSAEASSCPYRWCCGGQPAPGVGNRADGTARVSAIRLVSDGPPSQDEGGTMNWKQGFTGCCIAGCCSARCPPPTRRPRWCRSRRPTARGSRPASASTCASRDRGPARSRRPSPSTGSSRSSPRESRTPPRPTGSARPASVASTCAATRTSRRAATPSPRPSPIRPGRSSWSRTSRSSMCAAGEPVRNISICR